MTKDQESTRDVGLCGKYQVKRIDGRDMHPSDKHYGDRLFVLDPKHDLHARRALRQYAYYVGEDYPQLSWDLIRWVEELDAQDREDDD